MKPVASTYKARSALAIISLVFSPEVFRPLPTVLPRKGKQNNGHKIKSALLTDTYVKDKIPTIEASRNLRKKNCMFLTRIRKNL